MAEVLFPGVVESCLSLLYTQLLSQCSKIKLNKCEWMNVCTVIQTSTNHSFPWSVNQVLSETPQSCGKEKRKTRSAVKNLRLLVQEVRKHNFSSLFYNSVKLIRAPEFHQHRRSLISVDLGFLTILVVWGEGAENGDGGVHVCCAVLRCPSPLRVFF